MSVLSGHKIIVENKERGREPPVRKISVPFTLTIMSKDLLNPPLCRFELKKFVLVT